MESPMKLLDELKKQAKEVLKQEDQIAPRSESLEVFLHTEVENKLRQIHHYLASIIEQLRIIRPDVRTSRLIFDHGKINNLVQHNYRVFSETTYEQLVVGITFILECDQRCDISKVDASDMNNLINKLQHLGMDIVLQSKGRIEVEGKFPASLVFSANYHQHHIKFSINNIESVDSLNFELKPESITEDFLCEVGKMLLRRENRLVELAKELSTREKPQTPDKTESEDTEPTLTELMDFPLIHGLFNERHQLYLTYRENIQEVSSRNSGVVLGRSSSCDMVIPSDFASRAHARIVFRKGKFVVTDHSTNGTFIKPQGNKEVYIHGEDYPLTGSGFISLGESTTVDNEYLIYFSCH